MFGQGRPITSGILIAARTGCRTQHGRCLALSVCLCLAIVAQVGAQETDLRLRIEWGGGTARTWQGSVTLDTGSLSDPVCLGVEPDEPGSISPRLDTRSAYPLDQNSATGAMLIRQPRARRYDGFDVSIRAPGDGRLVVELGGIDAEPARVEIPLADLVNGYYDKPLDDQDNWLMVRRAPGDRIRVNLDRKWLIFSPGEVWTPEVVPHELELKPGTQIQFDFQLRSARGSDVLWSQTRPQVVADGVPPLPKMPLEVPLPKAEGVYELVISGSVRKLKFTGGFGRNMLREVLFERKLQVVVVNPQTPVPAQPGRLTVIDSFNASTNIWDRLNNLPLMPGRRTVLGNRRAEIWKYSHGDHVADMVRLPTRGNQPDVAWQAYPLRVDNPGVPHVLAIEYPGNIPQTLGISLLEPNAAGEIVPIGLDSGVYVPDRAADTPPQIKEHRLYFWPRTRAPILLLTNRRDDQRCVYGRIRVFEAGQLPPPPATIPDDQRLLAAYFDRPLFVENFSASEALDPQTGRSLKDWVTFYQGAARLVDYLRSTGRNGLFLAASSEGGSLYPSRVLQPTARFDTGVFFSSGQDPAQKDVLELLFRMFDRDRMQLIPVVQFATPLPKLESLRRNSAPPGLELVGADGHTWRERRGTPEGLAPYYNPLNPHVQEAMLEVVRELAARYADHGSFRGLAVDLSAEGFAVLPGVAWGLDDQTIARFEFETRVQVPGRGPDRFKQRAEQLSGPLASRWLAWRASVLGDFYRRMQAELQRYRPEARLYLTTGNLLSSPEHHRSLWNSLPRGVPLTEVLHTVGIDPAQYQDERSPVLMRPHVSAPYHMLPAGTLTQEVNMAPELDIYAQQSAVPASHLYHPPAETRVPSFDQQSPIKNTTTQLLMEALPSSYFNRQRFVHSLAAIDAQVIADGGWLLPLGQDDVLASFWQAYRELPAVRFQTYEKSPQPVVIRTYADQRRTWMYLVNDSDWACSARLRIDIPQGCRVEVLGGRQIPLPGAGMQNWSVDLEPYDLVAVRFTTPTVRLLDASVAGLGAVPGQMALELQDLDARVNALVRLEPQQANSRHVAWNLTEKLPNAGFELEPTANQSVPGWHINQTPGGQARVDRRQVHKGRQSVILSSNGPVATLASPPFEAPQTGRVLMAVWLRIEDQANQPPLRLALSAELNGQPYYRFAALGQGQPGAKVGTGWRRYLFRVDDLPLSGLSKLSVRFDLMGPGEVWIDHVQLASAVLSQGELLQLQRTIETARFALDSGRLTDCRRLLDGYWPKYLTAYVKPAPAAEKPARSEVPQAARRNEPPAPPPPAPSMFERLLPWRWAQ